MSFARSHSELCASPAMGRNPMTGKRFLLPNGDTRFAFADGTTLQWSEASLFVDHMLGDDEEIAPETWTSIEAVAEAMGGRLERDD